MHQYFQSLIQKLFSGNASSDEIQEINKWYDTFEIDQDIEIADHQKRTKSQIKAELYQNILQRTDHKKANRTRVVRLITTLAACFAIGLYGIFYLLDQSQSQENTIIQNVLTFSNEEGMIKMIKLPDGSKVYLHHNTEIEVESDFSKSRNISLSGKAFFDVVSNPNLPFVIKTENLETRVLGTSFSISAYKGMAETVGVKSGKVLVNSNDSQYHELTQDDLLQYENTKIELSKIQKPDLFFGWTEQTLVLIDSNIDELVKQIESWYGVSISYQKPKIHNCRVTGTYQKLSLEEMLQAIAFIIPIEYELKSKEVKINFGECK
ncbi:FecR family protein [Belliella kenyensis]|uniref:FecR family protein n=1 Tax=Belliella kenyensis TaxID=1472724 RepID=A0ABV8EIT6_9BACT|nr:FecR family protein [Belliella kenyensis]MCH7400313.1 FecR family protein [Belliella kenyensis]MDN3604669.1 FecR family protein [Belliella kenyensis]